MAQPEANVLNSLRISPGKTFDRMFKWGWIDGAGRSLAWFAHQKPNHNEQFEEPKEPRSQKGGKR